MTRIKQLRSEFVEFIPERLDQGVIYISQRYSTAAHLCCCGCGLEVITPLNPAKWQLIEKGGSLSLYPSVGNWDFPCQSHYWINGNRITWAETMSPEIISAVKARDRRDVETLAPKSVGLFARLKRWLIGALFGFLPK
jgi:hypothetical protein